MAGKRNHRAFGWVRKLPSKRYQASYLGPDGQRHLNPGGTFTAKIDAEGWLAREKPHRVDRLDASRRPEA
jgi:hypothetical protein